MKKTQKKLMPPSWSSTAFDFYFKNMTLGVLDIETTGLNPRRDHFVLGGLLLLSGKQATARQLFSEHSGEEKETLQAYLDQVVKADFLLTYNGTQFDLPFLQERAKGFCPPFPFNLDLYQVLNGHSSLRKFLPNLKQKTVEDFMGLWEHRTDEITGAESVILYHQYVASGDPEILNKILLHNNDDILQLYLLLRVLEKCNFHKAMYHFGFPIMFPGHRALVVEGIRFHRNKLEITGRQQGEGIYYQSYTFPFTIFFDAPNDRFQISLPFIRREHMVLADLQAMDLDPAPFEKYPACEEGFLILENHGKKNYLETNHLVKYIFERILDQWIIKK